VKLKVGGASGPREVELVLTDAIPEHTVR